MNIQWKIGQMSDRRLEAEIANRYHEYAQFRQDASADRVLGFLWAEFDLRVAAGVMTDDDEGLLNDTRKY